jgi:hypothetical protein
MSNKKEKEVIISKSIYEIQIDDTFVEVKTETDARRKFRSLVSKEGNNIAYLYRKDYNEKGKLIETYMIA